MTTLDSHATIAPDAQPVLIELRGPSGRLYGLLDRQRLIIEFKKGEQVERIDLRPYLEAARHGQ